MDTDAIDFSDVKYVYFLGLFGIALIRQPSISRRLSMAAHMKDFSGDFMICVLGKQSSSSIKNSVN
jgi:hypothetical protein